MKAVIKVRAINGENAFNVNTMDELRDATEALDRAGTDYTIEYRKV